MEKLSQYLENPKFIQWIFHPTQELETWWKQFQTLHPSEKHTILLARKILHQLKTNPTEFSESEKISLFTKILSGIEKKESARANIRQLLYWSRYAAIALVFFAIGALLFYERDTNQSAFQAYKYFENYPGSSGQLILASGQVVSLKSSLPELKVYPDGRIRIDGDTVVDSGFSKTTMNCLSMPWGKLARLVLADGTAITVNAGSQLIFPSQFTSSKREVLLEGKASFVVAKDKKHPFVVQTQDIHIKVLGTSFLVSAYSNQKTVETQLAEGKVSLNRAQANWFEDDIELLPNQMAIYDRNTESTTVRSVSLKNNVFWDGQMMKFESIELEKVIRELEHFYHIRFAFSSPELKQIRISGKLNLAENRHEVLNFLSSAAAIKITENEFSYKILPSEKILQQNR